MKLSYRCSSCKKDNVITTKGTNRHELQMELNSNEINERCKECGNFTKKHINRLYAETNYIPIVLGVLAAVIGTVLLWDFGLVSTLTATIPIGIWSMENKKASDFNKTMVK